MNLDVIDFLLTVGVLNREAEDVVVADDDAA